jgi:hypothetical protein
VVRVCNALHVSQRRACRVLEVSRNSCRYQLQTVDDEERLIERMTDLALQYGRWLQKDHGDVAQ